MFEKSHWKRPRATIASNYENNDYGYVFHGTSILIDLLDFANLTIQDCKKLKVLDYGCGTGRVARLFALTGAKVEGYDPVEECIQESEYEGDKLQGVTKVPTLSFNLDNLSTEFDLIYCVNVLEHLYKSDFDVALTNIVSRLKENGICLLWIHAYKNQYFLKNHNLTIDPTVVKGIVGIKGTKQGNSVIYEIINKK